MDELTTVRSVARVDDMKLMWLGIRLVFWSVAATVAYTAARYMR